MLFSRVEGNLCQQISRKFSPSHFFSYLHLEHFRTGKYIFFMLAITTWLCHRSRSALLLEFIKGRVTTANFMHLFVLIPSPMTLQLPLFFGQCCVFFRKKDEKPKSFPKAFTKHFKKKVSKKVLPPSHNTPLPLALFP